MKIMKKVQAGTLQSSDLMVFLEPAESLTVTIESTVLKQFGELIRAKVDEVLAKHGVEAGEVRITDRGALDYAIEARLETALMRAEG
ncbi:Citrate lyase gamma chain, acyl carrier protein [Citrifermentans bremense]|uniref:Citrate lyase subunit gamma n=2 Tax=Geobacteraceae TaxID=213422 RepID=A0ABQ0MN59_9BACT|nr:MULTISPECIES: citrate lyase acyl carrier protein [Geobacteraceae]BCG49003.1 Citrate lyase gamma chain, acyl carrier protein [Citrifermentans bremense]GAW68516.1 citrate lyase subunit gamma [Geoanaerobacter pelophilus]